MPTGSSYQVFRKLQKTLKDQKQINSEALQSITAKELWAKENINQLIGICP